MEGKPRIRKLLTVEQFEALDLDGPYLYELVRGRVVREPQPGELHGSLMARIVHYLYEHVEKHGLGRVVAQTGVVTERDPDSVRGPDVAYIAAARMNAYPAPNSLRIAPDLCIEVLSPSNRAGEMQQKVLEYLDAGARMVWVIDPRHRRATVYRSKTDIRILNTSDSLEGEDVLPGFRLPIAKLFAF